MALKCAWFTTKYNVFTQPKKKFNIIKIIKDLLSKIKSQGKKELTGSHKAIDITQYQYTLHVRHMINMVFFFLFKKSGNGGSVLF